LFRQRTGLIDFPNDSHTGSLFEQDARDNRPSTPDTEISDAGDLAHSLVKGDHDVATTEITPDSLADHSKASLDKPAAVVPTSIDTTSTVKQEIIPPPPVVTAASPTKYSMKPADLVGAVEDFSLPIRVTPKTSSPMVMKRTHTNDNHIVDPLLLSASKRPATPGTLANPPMNKKRKQLSPRRRRQADRLLSDVVN